MYFLVVRIYRVWGRIVVGSEEFFLWFSVVQHAAIDGSLNGRRQPQKPCIYSVLLDRRQWKRDVAKFSFQITQKINRLKILS